MQKTLIEVQNLCKYFGGLTAVNQLSFKLAEGEILGIIGPNGAGKTTVLNMIAGNILPSRGKIYFKDKDITGLPVHKRAREGIARVFQQDILFGSFSILENILVGSLLHTPTLYVNTFQYKHSGDVKPIPIYDKTAEILKFVSLYQHENELAINLPHGKKRLLSLAIALATQPKVLLLDEPLTGMNAEEVKTMVDIIHLLRNKIRITIIVVEHNLKAIMSVCDRIIVLNFGQKLTESIPAEIIKNPEVIKAYLGTEQNAF
jgi:branched-chain amino acid transport system ATP-binding protein